MLLGKTKKELDSKENEIKLFLSNNYKDSAYKAYKEYLDLVENFRSNGKINAKDYDKILIKIEDYQAKFANMKK